MFDKKRYEERISIYRKEALHRRAIMMKAKEILDSDMNPYTKLRDVKELMSK